MLCRGSGIVSLAGFRRAFLLAQLLQLMHEGIEILEIPVYRGKADICDIVERFQLVHDEHAYMLGRYFILKGIAKLRFYFMYYLLHLKKRNRALLA